MLCGQEADLVFAAARGAGKLLVLDAVSGDARGEVGVGHKPNGLAWDPQRRHVLAADVADLRARLVDPYACRVLADLQLPGRPRWCVYDRTNDRFLVNIREPACITVLDAEAFAERGRWPISPAGPHGLDLDLGGGRVFVVCDDGVIAALDLSYERDIATVEIGGEPDAIWCDPEHSRLYVTIGRPAFIDVIDTAAMARVERARTE